MIIEFISIVIGVIFMTLMFQGGSMETLIMYLDLPTLMCILVLSMPILFRNGLWKDFLRAFKMLHKKFDCSLSDIKRSLDAVEFMQKQVLYAGIIIVCVSLIYVLCYVDNPELVGPCIAVVLIGMLYTAAIELILLPLQLEAKRRIIDYMEKE
ncbi:MAG: hypothetical protein IJN92_09915 [Lachnospiraceae bacterium]|nr:hypothetical protein [Lachnospiraceae bacterium]